MIARAATLAPALLWSVAIFLLSHQSTLPSAPGGDKLAHFLAYTVGGASYLLAAGSLLRWSRLELWALATSAAMLFGALDEVHQSFVPGRSPSVGDALADAAGAVVGAALMAVAFSVARSRASPGKS